MKPRKLVTQTTTVMKQPVLHATSSILHHSRGSLVARVGRMGDFTHIMHPVGFMLGKCSAWNQILGT